MKNKTAYFVICLLVLTVIGLSVNTVEAKPANSKAPDMQFVEEIFIDFAAPAHGGPGPHPTSESSNFKLTQGGIRWFTNATNLEYLIDGTEGVAGGNNEIIAAENTWDGFITTRIFDKVSSTTQNNPCRGSPSIVNWVSIDGSGNVLASASVCRDVATKEILGFVINIDTDETWSTDGSSGTFDVQNIISHEFGHVAGLGHDNPPKSGCLTMYKFSSQEETQKRTLGLGDKLGMDALYSTGDTSPGAGCGL